DVDRERTALRVVDDPDVQHRRRGHVDGSQRTRRVGGHQAELEPDQGEADVLVLMPRSEGTTGVWSEGADALHLKHRTEQHWPVMCVGVHEALWMVGIQDWPLLVSLVEPMS